jgi:hypothetical protein
LNTDRKVDIAFSAVAWLLGRPACGDGAGPLTPAGLAVVHAASSRAAANAAATILERRLRWCRNPAVISFLLRD